MAFKENEKSAIASANPPDSTILRPRQRKLPLLCLGVTKLHFKEKKGPYSAEVNHLIVTFLVEMPDRH